MLLLTACRALANVCPAPPVPVAREVLALVRSVAAAPRPAECGHDGGHPAFQNAASRTGLPHFYAPDAFPPEGEPLGPEAWMCPRFAGAVAEECVADLEGLGEDEGEDE